MNAAKGSEKKERIIHSDKWHNMGDHGYNGWGAFNERFFPATDWMPMPDLPER